jgi:lysophospholipase L1-like esterase
MTQVPHAKPDLRVCFVGDSFTQGVGDPEYLGWVGRVLRASRAAGHDITGFNLGVRRDTSADVLRRCWHEVDRRVADLADNRLVLSFGANDAAEENGLPRVEPTRTLDHLATLLDAGRSRDMRLLVVGPVPAVGMGREHIERVLTLAARFEDACAAREVPFVPVTAAVGQCETWIAEVMAGDGAHPAASGYAWLAEFVLANGWWAWLPAVAATAEADLGRHHGTNG